MTVAQVSHERVVERLWRDADRDRDRYLALLRERGYIYERENGVTVHTVDNPNPPNGTT